MIQEESKILTVNNLSLGYQNNKLISSFSVSAKEGQLIALMGLNGSGKTTFFRTLLKETTPLSGEIIFGKEEEKTNLQDFVSIVYTERVSIFGCTVKELISMGRMPHTNFFGKLKQQDIDVINQSINQLQLNDIVNMQINSLSDGQFQKVMIARALTQETPLLLLDEPTAFLDVKNKVMIYDLLKELTHKFKKTIIVSTHQLEFAKEYCKLIWLFHNGKFNIMEPENLTEMDFD